MPSLTGTFELVSLGRGGVYFVYKKSEPILVDQKDRPVFFVSAFWSYARIVPTGTFMIRWNYVTFPSQILTRAF